MFEDAHLVKESWGRLEPVAGQLAARFYARLFLASPELRAMFPVVLERQQSHFLLALRRVVQGLDSPLLLERYLLRLGQDHRKFAVAQEHYLPFGRALIATLREFSGPEWDERTEEAWITAYATVADRMMAGAARRADTPAWWDAVVVDHRRPAPDIAVLRIRPSRPYPYYPGQFLSLQTPLRAQLWRTYSIANAPDPQGTLELHVRAVPGGWVSGALVRHTAVGDPLRLGPPLGAMQVDPESDRDLLFVAGGTGLAPCQAMVEHLARWNIDRRAHVYVGARTAEELYGLSALRRLAEPLRWLTVVGVVSDDPGYFGRHGLVGEAVAADRRWDDHDVYVSGPPPMVRSTVDALATVGVPPALVRHDPFG
ncbi:MAG TPA: FAD-binding oxidoreductase [Mycobacteriales bacterium]